VSYSRFWIAAVVPLATLLFVSPVAAREPQIAFAVKDGWVEITVTHDDKPVADAQVRVITLSGHKFAEGETGPEGRGEFPLPPGTDFRVEIKVGDRNADPIRLTKIDDHVVPTNVLLSFGISPCCKLPSRGSMFGSGEKEVPIPSPQTSPPGSMPIWMQAGCAVAFTILGVFILLGSRRSTSKEPS
jgi:hypothetical protein